MAFDIDFLSGGNRQLAAFLVLAALLGSFAFIRTSARLARSPKVPWWPGSVKSGELHIHHLVFGIILLLVAGFLAFALRNQQPSRDILAVVFGIGAGLTLDEFALWLHLEDVYWAEEGRQSVDAVVIAALLGGLVIVGATPVTRADAASTVPILLSLVIALTLSALAALKGKYVSAVAGMLLPPIALIAAIRLAKPESRWAGRRYAPGGRKLARATARFERLRARQRRLQDLIGGAPSTSA